MVRSPKEKIEAANGKGLHLIGRSAPINFKIRGFDRKHSVQPEIIRGLNDGLNLGQVFMQKNSVDLKLRSHGNYLVMGGRTYQLINTIRPTTTEMDKIERQCNTVTCRNKAVGSNVHLIKSKPTVKPILKQTSCLDKVETRTSKKVQFNKESTKKKLSRKKPSEGELDFHGKLKSRFTQCETEN